MRSLVIAAVLVVATQASAQESQRKPKPKKLEPVKRPTDWESSWRAALELGFNTNVFLLDRNARQRLEDDLPSDQISDRFDGMESVEDLTLTPSIGVTLKGPSPLGRTAELTVELEYEQYFQSTDRSHLRGRAGASQGLWKDGRLSLDLDFTPSYFNKNYLADATDFTGDVSSSERRYEAGTYREWELAAKYRHQLVEQETLTLDAIGGAALRGRDYNSPFSGRDELGTMVWGELKAGGWKRVKCSLEFGMEFIDSPTRDEVVLLDETFYGLDLNGDGDAVDVKARSVQAVSRSRTATFAGLSVSVELSPQFTLRLGWKRTWKDYDSNEPFDESHRDRKDVNDEIAASLKIDIDKGWNAAIGYELTVQDTDRPSDPDATGETVDYRRGIFTVSLNYKW